MAPGLRQDGHMTTLSLDGYTSIPRVTGLLLSPDGRRLVLTVQSLAHDATRFVSALWELDPGGTAPPRRLTWSEGGESSPAFLSDGSLVFRSARPDPAGRPPAAGGSATDGLWLLPGGGGEARPLLRAPGGILDVAAARGAEIVVVRALRFPGSVGSAADAELARRRAEAGVTGVLHDAWPLRWWDRELGPRWARLLRLRDAGSASPASEPEEITPDAAGSLEATGSAEDQGAFAVSPDGEVVVSTWARATGPGVRRSELVLIGAGGRRTLSRDGLDYGRPRVSPDGRRVLALATDPGTPERPPSVRLWLCDLESGEAGPVAGELDVWPDEAEWSADGGAIYFTADLDMQRPVFRYDLSSRRVERLTAAGAFQSLCPAPDGRGLHALRTSWSSPLEVVRIGPDGEVTGLPTPGLPLELPSTVSAIHAAAPDGTRIPAWLVMPRDASPSHPAPLVLWIHGGPFSSWNAWSWRWCPHLLAERGYAVLLPDPALSTGHGAALVGRAWGEWGDRVMGDLFAVLDAALQRPDLDASRTAAMGGSFGGYMAAWIAGHSDRFRAIVDHAGLWSLEQFHGTTDEADSWEHQFGTPESDPRRYAQASPDRSVAAIRTPMLVIHGGRDFRVPVSEALRLWNALQRHGVPSQLLYFPDENHWVLTPGNGRLWYETVLAFLDHHVRGEPLRRPDLL